jgi:hypothetical protein
MFIVLTVLLAGACFAPSVAKLSAHPKMQASAGHFGIPWPQYRMIGVAEMLAGAGVIAGLFWPPIGIAAALGMIALLAGALATHRRAGDPIREAIPAVFSLVLCAAYVAALAR